MVKISGSTYELTYVMKEEHKTWRCISKFTYRKDAMDEKSLLLNDPRMSNIELKAVNIL
jgi:hypothetical protein